MNDIEIIAGRMSYKGFIGSSEISIKDRVLHGRVVGTGDLVTYQSDSVSGLIEEFKSAVDDYIKTSEGLGELFGSLLVNTVIGNVMEQIDERD